MVTPASTDFAASEFDGRFPVPVGPPQSRLNERAADVPWFLDLREVLHTLRLRRMLVTLPVLAVLGLAVAALLLIPAQYSATTKILIDPHGLQVVKDDLNPPGQTSDASLLLVDSQMLVVSSDDVLRKVVDGFALDKDPEFVGRTSILSAVVASIPRLFGLASMPVDAKLAALRSLRDRLTVQRIDRSFVLSLAVSTEDREKSARLASGIAETYLSAEMESRADVARRATASITSRLGELQASVRDADDRAQAFRTANNLVGTKVQLVSEQQLGQISDQLGAAKARAAEQLSRLNQIEAVYKAGGSLDALPEVLQSTTIGLLRTQLAQAERNVAETATRLGSRHPAMISAQDQVRTARAQLDAEVKRIAVSVRNEYKATAANVAALSQTLEKQKSDAVSVGGAMVGLRELERQTDARRSVYEAFLVRARELQEQQQLDTSASRIISPATPPAHRQGPPAAVILVGALVAGLGLGTALALVVERITGRIRTGRRLGQRSGLDVLGAMPPHDQDDGRRGAADSTRLFADGRYDHAVNRLRDHLDRLLPGKSRAILVTAADQVSGKSRLAMTLAAIAGSDHDRVLLVDADPDGSLASEYGLGVAPQPVRVQGGRPVLPEGRVDGIAGLRFVSVSRQAARTDSRIVADMIFSRADAFDMIVINAGLVGTDLFTDRLVNDPRLSMTLVAASAARSTFAPIERALPTIEPGRPTAFVLTDASTFDA